MDKPVETVDKGWQKTDKNAVLGIFAKQPIPGQVKTRLCPPFTPEAAAALFLCSLQETVERMQTSDNYDLVICYSGAREWFETTFPGVLLLPQQGADLGARMAAALADFLGRNYSCAVLIGSDSPDLPIGLVEQAFSVLQQVEVVLAPATDGGYVLIGEAIHHPEIFSGIKWSSDEVLEESLRRIDRLGIRAEQLSGWDDLDDRMSLRRFLKRSPESRTATYLQQQLSQYL